MDSQPPVRRYARRSLFFGLAAFALHVLGPVLAVLSQSFFMPEGEMSFEEFQKGLGITQLIAIVGGLLGTLAALAGVAHAAIASHRRERGITLIVAWILSVLAASGLQPFLYTEF